MKQYFYGLASGVLLGLAAFTAANYTNPFFPLVLFCGEGLGWLWGAGRCF